MAELPAVANGFTGEGVLAAGANETNGPTGVCGFPPPCTPLVVGTPIPGGNPTAAGVVVTGGA